MYVLKFLTIWCDNHLQLYVETCQKELQTVTYIVLQLSQYNLRRCTKCRRNLANQYGAYPSEAGGTVKKFLPKVLMAESTHIGVQNHQKICSISNLWAKLRVATPFLSDIVKMSTWLRKVVAAFPIHQNVRNCHIYIDAMKQHIV